MDTYTNKCHQSHTISVDHLQKRRACVKTSAVCFPPCLISSSYMSVGSCQATHSHNSLEFDDNHETLWWPIIKNKSIYDHLWINYNYSTNYLIIIRIISEPWTVTSLSLPPLPLAMRGDGFRGALKRYDLTMDVTKRNRPTESTWLYTTQWNVVWYRMYFFLPGWIETHLKLADTLEFFQTCFEDIVDGFPSIILLLGRVGSRPNNRHLHWHGWRVVYKSAKQSKFGSALKSWQIQALQIEIAFRLPFMAKHTTKTILRPLG